MGRLPVALNLLGRLFDLFARFLRGFFDLFARFFGLVHRFSHRVIDFFAGLLGRALLPTAIGEDRSEQDQCRAGAFFIIVFSPDMLLIVFLFRWRSGRRLRCMVSKRVFSVQEWQDVDRYHSGSSGRDRGDKIPNSESGDSDPNVRRRSSMIKCIVSARKCTGKT